MAEEGTFATNALVEMKAGANCSATSKAEGYTNEYLKEAESQINAATRFNWHDVYSSLNTDTKYILQEAAANLAAIYVISYDMSGFSSRVEAEDMINILRDAALRCISILRDKKVEQFINES